MPITVTVHQAKTNLSDLLRRVEAGEEIIIARGDTPVAILRDYKSEDTAKRRAAGMGSLAGTFAVPPDSAFFDPLTSTEIDDLFGADSVFFK
jgi:prevent-host-death family protein